MLLPFPAAAQRARAFKSGIEWAVHDLPFVFVVVKTFEPEPVRVRDKAIRGHAGLHARF